MLPGLVCSPPLAWNVGTSPPQVIYGTSTVAAGLTGATVTGPTSFENGSWASRLAGKAARSTHAESKVMRCMSRSLSTSVRNPTLSRAVLSDADDPLDSGESSHGSRRSPRYVDNYHL